jgi:hypothetical protein
VPHIIRMTPPKGPAEFWPVGFGHASHAHTLNEAEAERFDDPAIAARMAQRYRFPPAFWDSERRHAENQARKFRGWNFEVIEVAA